MAPEGWMPAPITAGKCGSREASIWSITLRHRTLNPNCEAERMKLEQGGSLKHQSLSSILPPEKPDLLTHPNSGTNCGASVWAYGWYVHLSHHNLNWALTIYPDCFLEIQRQDYSLFTMEIIQLPAPQGPRVLPYQLQSCQVPSRILLGTHFNSSANLEDDSFRHHPNLAYDYCKDSEAPLWRGSHPHPGSQVCFIFTLGTSLSLNPIFKIYIKMSLGAGKMAQSFQGTLHTLG